MRRLWPALLLSACDATLTGEVRGTDGQPVVGASLHADGLEADCDAVTGPDGRFRVRCPQGAWSFDVRHPAFLPGTWSVTADRRGDIDVGATELVRVPTDPGLHLSGEGGFFPLPDSPLVRTIVAGKEHRFCVAGAPLAVPAGRVRLLDNHVAEWRVFQVDAEGCAWRLVKGTGDHWAWAAERVAPVATEPLAEGRTWVDLDLPPGDYVVAEWYADFFVRQDVAADTWRASWIRAGGAGPG